LPGNPLGSAIIAVLRREAHPGDLFADTDPLSAKGGRISASAFKG